MRQIVRDRAESAATMNVVLKKTFGFLKLIKDLYSGMRKDGPAFGYWNAFRWHWIPVLSQICYYTGIRLIVKPIRVQLHGNAVWLRPQTTDYYIYQQVFCDQEYADVDDIKNVEFILDCGANIGLASIYFLNRFPGSRVLAIEPDPENASMCRRNLLPYGARATVLEGGVWSHSGRLTVFPSEFGPAQKCGMQVRPFREGDPQETSVDAFDIPSLLTCGQAEKVDVLKIDIERSELVLFSSSPELWLPKVRNLVIELHDAECSRALFSALEGYDYRLSERGDLTYCLDLKEVPVARREATL